MSPETVLSTGEQALEVTVALVLVLLVPALLTGLLIGMIQAATQINELTLSFVPKLLVTFLVMLVAGPWLLALISDFTRRLFENLPYLIE